MPNDLALIDADFSREKIDLIKSMVAKDCSDDELKLFLYTCKRTGLDPLARQIYAIKRSGKMTIQTGIDGYRVIADRTGKLAGITDYEFVEATDGKKPDKATVTVRKVVMGGTIAEFTATARWGEYCAGGPMWQKMPFLMLGKCAEALALRKAFPADLSGVYTAEEMEQADNPVRDEVFAEVDRQRGVAKTMTLPEVVALSSQLPPELDWSFNKASGVLICKILDAKLASKKDKPTENFVIVQINGKIDGSKKDKAYYWHSSNRELLLNNIGKSAKFVVTPKGDFPTIAELLEIEGKKVEVGTMPSFETQARLLASTMDFEEGDLNELHVKLCGGSWMMVLEKLKEEKERRDTLHIA